MKPSKRYEELLNICVKAKHSEKHTAMLVIAGDVFVVTHLHEWTAKKEKKRRRPFDTERVGGQNQCD